MAAKFVAVFAAVLAVGRCSVLPLTAAVVAAPTHSTYTNFAYDVADPNTGDFKSQSEIRVGGNVQGQYSLLDSDGTRRTVDYTADDINGFNAIVRKDPAVFAAEPIIAAPVISEPIVTAPIARTLVESRPVLAKSIAAPIVSAPVITGPVAAAPIRTVVDSTYYGRSAPIISGQVITGPVSAAPVRTVVDPTYYGRSAPIISGQVITGPVSSAPVRTVVDPTLYAHSAPIVTGARLYNGALTAPIYAQNYISSPIITRTHW